MSEVVHIDTAQPPSPMAAPGATMFRPQIQISPVEESPSKKLDRLLAAPAAKATILSRILNDAPLSDEERASAADMAPERLRVTPVEQQGQSRRVYTVGFGDHDYILSVDQPPTATNAYPRAGFSDVKAFQERLNSHGCPAQQLFGNPFRIDGIEHECTLSNFIHGYQIKLNTPFKPEEITSLGETLAGMHKACLNFAPPGYRKPHSVQSSRLPQGFVHRDIHPGNIIFDRDSSKVAGVIDYENTGYDFLFTDIERFIYYSLVQVLHDGDDKLTVRCASEDMARFFKAYNSVRQLSAAECEQLCDNLGQRLTKYIANMNRYLPQPLDERQSADFTQESIRRFKAELVSDIFPQGRPGREVD